MSGRLLGLFVSGLMIVLGGLWWANGSQLVGPILAGLGVALAIVVVQNARR